MSFLFPMCGGRVIGPQDYMQDLRYPFHKTFHKMGLQQIKFQNQNGYIECFGREMFRMY